jgi:hypothetical protein
MDPVFTNGDTLPKLPENIKGSVHLSDLSRIDTSLPPAVPPIDLFGQEPEDVWCYFFEKVDLARQLGEWQQAAALAIEAAERNLGPMDSSEWMPFIETYALTGRMNDATELTEVLVASTPLLQTGMCQTWERITKYKEFSRENLPQAVDLMTTIQCESVPSLPQEQP